MTAQNAPTTDLVVRAWLNGVVGIVNAGPTLPEDVTKWSTDGFVVHTTVAGAPDIYTQLRRPLVQLDFYAVTPSSKKAPWGQANALAETVLAASLDQAKNEVTVTLGNGYKPARVLSTIFVSEPRAIRDQHNDTARFTADLQILWVTS